MFWFVIGLCVFLVSMACIDWLEERTEREAAQTAYFRAKTKKLNANASDDDPEEFA